MYDQPHIKTGVHNVAQPVSVSKDDVWVSTKRRLNFEGDSVTITADDTTGVITIGVDGVISPVTINSWSAFFTPQGAFVDPVTAPSMASGWPTANLSLFLPFTLHESGTITRIYWYNGSTASGNVNMAIFRSDLTKLVESGSTAQSGTSTQQVSNIADTAITAGNYYFALVVDNTTGRIARHAPAFGLAEVYRMAGCFQQASNFALASPATPVAYAQGFIPMMGIELVRMT